MSKKKYYKLHDCASLGLYSVMGYLCMLGVLGCIIGISRMKCRKEHREHEEEDFEYFILAHTKPWGDSLE